ncbi:MAG: nucleotidyltransferase domain-containing protein [Candidatus Methanoperedens sp.]|nr:nucleotidyltransferase domain-containing protein [Candidatus Methanoperedens sp.]
MISQLRDERLIAEGFIDSCKRLFGNSLKAIVLFGSRASGAAKKHSDFDVLVIAKNLPVNWRKRDSLALELDKHGIFDIVLYTENELEDAIHAVNPLVMNIFDSPHKILYGNSFIDRVSRLYTKEITVKHILRIGKSTWKIGGIDV